MHYLAIYPEQAIEAHRAFIAGRRSERPSQEYRTPTPEDWESFLGHFERRKVALGTCGRAYGSTCIHEHACVGCPVLLVLPRELGRLEEIRDNLVDRISEAEREGRLGEMASRSASPRPRGRSRKSPLSGNAGRWWFILGLPTFPEIASRANHPSANTHPRSAL